MPNLEGFWKRFRKRRFVRPYEFFTIVVTTLTILVLYFGNFAPTSLYRSDTWAQMSITVGAADLTVVAIIASIVVSNENNKRAEMTDNLTIMSNRIEGKKAFNPDLSLNEIYDSSKQTLDDAIVTFSPIKYYVSLIGFLSFFILLLSALFAIEGFPFKLTLGSFLIGIVLLSGYVIYVAEEFVKMDSLSSPKKKKGELTLLATKINGVAYKVDITEKKGIITTNRQIERIEFKVRFQGNLRNGFLHATVGYSNGIVSFIPDANTYLSNIGFANDFILVIFEKNLDTGILQTKGDIDLSFELILRSQKGSEINPPIANTYVDNLGMQTMYKHCSIVDNFRVNSVMLRMVEDPLFRQNYKRRDVDFITLQINEPESRRVVGN